MLTMAIQKMSPMIMNLPMGPITKNQRKTILSFPVSEQVESMPVDFVRSSNRF